MADGGARTQVILNELVINYNMEAMDYALDIAVEDLCAFLGIYLDHLTQYFSDVTKGSDFGRDEDQRSCIEAFMNIIHLSCIKDSILVLSSIINTAVRLLMVLGESYCMTSSTGSDQEPFSSIAITLFGCMVLNGDVAIYKQFYPVIKLYLTTQRNYSINSIIKDLIVEAIEIAPNELESEIEELVLLIYADKRNYCLLYDLIDIIYAEFPRLVVNYFNKIEALFMHLYASNQEALIKGLFMHLSKNDPHLISEHESFFQSLLVMDNCRLGPTILPVFKIMAFETNNLIINSYRHLHRLAITKRESVDEILTIFRLLDLQDYITRLTDSLNTGMMDDIVHDYPSIIRPNDSEEDDSWKKIVIYAVNNRINEHVDDVVREVGDVPMTNTLESISSSPSESDYSDSSNDSESSSKDDPYSSSDTLDEDSSGSGTSSEEEQSDTSE